MEMLIPRSEILKSNHHYRVWGEQLGYSILELDNIAERMPIVIRNRLGEYRETSWKHRDVDGENVKCFVLVDEHDLVNQYGGITYKCLDHGSVLLDDMMPRIVWRTADDAVLRAARVSTGRGANGLKHDAADRALIRYLFSHRHTTPFEMVEFKFFMRLPVFVARQWIRHRTANVNEFSARYTEVPDRFYRPEEVRGQGTTNKQGSDGVVTLSEEMNQYLDAAEALHATYKDLVNKGCSRELARIGLPLSMYTEWFWKIDLHNLLHLISLRSHPHAQYEIRVFSDRIADIVAAVCPWTWEAYCNYRRDAMVLSYEEIMAIKSGEYTLVNKREADALIAKVKQLGLQRE